MFLSNRVLQGKLCTMPKILVELSRLHSRTGVCSLLCSKGALGRRGGFPLNSTAYYLG